MYICRAALDMHRKPKNLWYRDFVSYSNQKFFYALELLNK